VALETLFVLFIAANVYFLVFWLYHMAKIVVQKFRMLRTKVGRFIKARSTAGSSSLALAANELE